MINKLKLVNFRNFHKREFFFTDKKNIILGNNGKWKTNILEALSLLTGTSLLGIDFENLVQHGKDVFYIEIENEHQSTMSISYSQKENKKKYFINGKITTLKKIREYSPISVLFSPITMNMMYLSPSLRRDFLDTILSQTFWEYQKILKNYKQSVIQRNNVLKNINKWKSVKNEIDYWNTLFINNCVEVYQYRKKIINFLQSNNSTLLQWFGKKIDKITIIYLAKINIKEENINILKQNISDYLHTSFEKEIILKTTTIWPHRDDFMVYINDDIKIVDFASRWEVKTLILWLKKLEIDFIQKYTEKKPILIIDDILSELDELHKNILLDEIEGYQVFMNGIHEGDYWDSNKIELI